MKNDNRNSDKIKDAAGKYADKRSFVLPYDGSNKFYDDKIHDCANESFKAGAEWAIAQFQSQQKQSGVWVKASERLPDNGATVKPKVDGREYPSIIFNM